MQRYTIFFIIVNALHVLGAFSAHHQDIKNSTHSIWYVPGLLAASASVVDLEMVCIQISSNSTTLAVAASKLDIYQMLCVEFLSS
jgi:hypothetical protein